MKVLLRNFLALFHRYRVAMTLNLLGLSVAFAAFMVLMAQWRYDSTFDEEVPNSDCIVRLNINWSDEGKSASICRPLAEQVFLSSPHIVAGALRSSYTMNPIFHLDDKSGGRHSFRETVLPVTKEYPHVFGFEMLEGSADVLSDPHQLLISESQARRLFGNTSAIGKRLETGMNTYAEDGVYYVGGVYKDFPRNSSVENCFYCSLNKENEGVWANWNYIVYLRLDSPDALESLIPEVNEQLVRNGIDLKAERDANLFVLPLPDIYFANDFFFDNSPKANRATVFLLFTIGWVILLIAAINYTNFSIALGPVRMKSLNTQRVLGSTVETLRRGLVMEAVAFSFVAYLLSVLWFYLFGMSPLASLVPASLALSEHVGLLIFTAGVACVLGVAAGMYPAYYVTSFQPALVLKGSFGLSPAGRRLRTVLMGVQYVAAFSLIIGALFMYLQNYYTRTASLGYDKDALLVVDLNSKTQAASEALRSNLERIAGVEGVTFGNHVLSSQDNYMSWSREHRGESINLTVLPVDYRFLSVLDIPVEEGRDFLPSDAQVEGNNGSLIVNQTAAKQYGISVGDKVGTMPVVGIMSDIHYASMRRTIGPMAFLVSSSYWYSPFNAYIQVKKQADVFDVRAQIAEALNQFDPDYPFNIRFYDTVLESLYTSEAHLGQLILLFSLLAIFISIVGVFGLVVFDSEYKRKEIGIRKVMGATTQEILWMFNRSYLRMLSICFVIATPLAWYAVHAWLQNFAYKTPMYVWVYAAAFVIVALITIATVTYQNWRAANANPVESIKTE